MDNPIVDKDYKPSDVFSQLCPTYMAMGMTYDEYWNGDVLAPRMYREKYKLQQQQDDIKAWMQGMYIYEVLCDVSPLFQFMSKKAVKVRPYSDKPYSFKNETKQETERKLTSDEIKQGRLAFRVQMDSWMRSTRKQFTNKKKGGVNNGKINKT